MSTTPVSATSSTASVRFAGSGGDEIHGLLVTPMATAPDHTGRVGDSFGILLVHGAEGPDQMLRELAERLAVEGFHVLVPDLFMRGAPVDLTDAEQLRARRLALPDRRALQDLEAGADYLASLEEVDADGLAVLGLSMGGTLAFLMGCTSTKIAAVVDFYGTTIYAELDAQQPVQPIELHLNLDRPLLAFFGEEDDQNPAEHVALLSERLTAGSKDFEIVTYPGAGHGFLDPRRSGYHKGSAENAWRRTLAFLEENL